MVRENFSFFHTVVRKIFFEKLRDINLFTLHCTEKYLENAITHIFREINSLVV